MYGCDGLQARTLKRVAVCKVVVGGMKEVVENFTTSMKSLKILLFVALFLFYLTRIESSLTAGNLLCVRFGDISKRRMHMLTIA